MKDFLLAVVLAFTWAAADAADIKHMSAGIGADSSDRMSELGKEYNLRLLFAAKDGHYLADVAVSIADSANRKLLEAVADGPFFFAVLPPGKYTITVTYAGAVQSRATTVAASGRRELVFRWEEPADPSEQTTPPPGR